MRAAYSVQQIRDAEAELIARLGDEPLMRRAATGLAITCSRLLRDVAGVVPGSRVVLLVGSGNNGGDTLWAGAWLAARGASVEAVILGEHCHEAGLKALLSAGGKVVASESGAAAVAAADLVIDGIVGIGGTGPLREQAAALARECALTGAMVVACDLPSGIDADTGAVVDADAVVRADVSVTFGALKPGLLLMPAAEFVGVLELVDIGLTPHLPRAADVMQVQAADVALALPTALPDDHKYSRGVVGVCAGSDDFPGAALLVVGAATHGGAGMVKCVVDSDLARAAVISRCPEVVVAGYELDSRVTAEVVGPGLSRDRESSILEVDRPVVLDATALRWIATRDDWAHALRERGRRGQVTVLTPHEGEFAALHGGMATDPLTAAREAAREWGAVVLLKGATTVIASPSGSTWVNPVAPAALATAGSGDVLAGLLGSWLACSEARARQEEARLTSDAAALIAACAAWVHALAGRIAADDGRPVTASTVLEALPTAIAAVRTGTMDE